MKGYRIRALALQLYRHGPCGLVEGGLRHPIGDPSTQAIIADAPDSRAEVDDYRRGSLGRE